MSFHDQSKTPLKVILLLCLLYVAAPFTAGLVGIGDKRGPRFFPEEMHVIIYTIGYSLTHDTKPRISRNERPWMYGGTEKLSLNVLLAERTESILSCIGSIELERYSDTFVLRTTSLPVRELGTEEWHPGFATNGVLAVNVSSNGLAVTLLKTSGFRGDLLILSPQAVTNLTETMARDRSFQWRSDRIWTHKVRD